MTVIAVDGLSEEDFRRAIENRLREGKPAAALERLRRLLADFAGPGRILPERFLTIEAKDLVLRGWQELEPAMQRHDRPGRPITALSVAFGWPGEEVPQPDENGHLRPFIETGYYTDDAYPFSQSARDDLLDGYSYHGCTWAADCQAVDNALSLEGVDDLHGALAVLEARLLASEEPDPDGILAGSLGACLLSVLLFEAVSQRIERDGLPRPLCVMAGSNGVYPYFDAPVAGFPEDARKAAEVEEEEPALSTAIPGPRYSSLLLTGVPRGTKRAVLVLQESEAETAARFAHLRDQSHIGAEPGPPLPPASPDPVEPALPEPEIADLAASPLLAKKQPGKAWDFRDMLSSRDSDGPQGGREEVDWDEWPEEPDSDEPRAPESGRIDWGQPFKASPLLGIEPPAAAPDPVDWDLPPAPPEPATESARSAPVEWPEEPQLPVAEEAQALEPAPLDWDEPSDEPPSLDIEPPALAAESAQWVEAPAAAEPIAEFAPFESVDWHQEPQPPVAEEVQALEPGSIDWDEPSATSQTPEAQPPASAAEPVDWPEASLSHGEDEPGSIDWGVPAEVPTADSDPFDGEPGTIDWPDHLAAPGFSLLEPSPEATVSIAYAPLAPFEVTGPKPEPEPEPVPAAADPRDLPIPDWPLGLGWLEDHAQPEIGSEPPRPSLWDRLRMWLGSLR